MSEPPVPETCPNGHPLGPGKVRVGWLPCGCPGGAENGGHRTWTCTVCMDAGQGDAGTIYDPPHDPDYRTRPDGSSLPPPSLP